MKRSYSKRFERNLLACWKRANPEHLSEGMGWYQRANATACIYAGRHGCTLDQAVGVIAALSPGRNWEVNLQDADTFLNAWKLGDRGRDLPKVGSYGRRNIQKCVKIMKELAPLDVLGGLKVRAFYACMIDPTNATEVCVDRHAKSAAHGKKLADRESVVRKGEYPHLAGHYCKIAGAIGVLPHQFQAVVWVVWRSLRGNLEQQDLFYSEVAYEQAAS